MTAPLSLGWWGVALAVAAGAVRGGTPILFVSVGECLTEKSGKINLGLEGTLVMGAMTAYAVSYRTGSPWLGVLVAGLAGMALGSIHAWLCQKANVNDIAVGIAMIIFGSGLAFYFGKPYIEPVAPQLPSLRLGWWSAEPQVRAALTICPLFFAGVALAFAMGWFFRSTRWGLWVRAAGDAPAATRAMGISVTKVRTFSIVTGSFLAGVAGAYLSLFYPGVWTEAISSGQGIMAVALVIFAGWDPVRCLWASLLFGAAQAVGPALQGIGAGSDYYLWNASPYVLTLAVMAFTCSPQRALAGAPGSLGTLS